jgi:hypothetical protein
MPTSHPTQTFAPTSQPTTYYHGFQAENMLSYQLSDYDDNFGFRYEFALDEISDYNNLLNVWENFIYISLNTPFRFDYYELKIWIHGIKYGESVDFMTESVCNDTETNNLIINAIKENGDITIACNGNGEIWTYRNSTLCVGCSNSTSGDSFCPIPGDDNVIMFPELDCQDQISNPMKIAGVLSTKSRLYIQPSVPKLFSLSSVSTNNSITMSMTIEYQQPGYLITCAALPVNYILESLDEIRGAEIQSSITKDALEEGIEYNAEIVIYNVISSTSYNIYCLSEDTLDQSESLDRTIDYLIIATTECCREISYTNTPMFVYQDPSIYEPSQILQYLFTYTLASVPNSELIITPTIASDSNSINSTYITVSPSYTKFTSLSTTKSLVSSFVLTAAITGYFNINLLLSGVDSNKYSSSEITVRIISSDAPKPPPELKNVKFIDSCAGLSAKFDGETDYGESVITTLTWSCDNLFEFIGANTSTCTWKSSNEVLILFSKVTPSTISSDDTVIVKGNIIKAACPVDSIDCNSYNYSDTSSSVVNLPKNPPAINILWNVATVIGSCDNLVIDTSMSYGSGGREWEEVKYSVSATNGQTGISTPNAPSLYDIQVYLNNKTSPSIPFTIPGNILNSSLIYTFSLKLTNFLDTYNSKSIKIIRDTRDDIPFVSIIGNPSRYIKESDSLTINAQGVPSSCSKNKYLKYSWKIYKNNYPDLTLTSASLSPNKMKIKP